MAHIDKIFGTQQQYDQLEKWLSVHNKEALNGLYPKGEYYDLEIRPISNFSKKIDLWLLENCPIKWVTDRIRAQYELKEK